MLCCKMSAHTRYVKVEHKAMVKWTITQTHPFYIFTLMYTGGDKNGTTYPRFEGIVF